MVLISLSLEKCVFLCCFGATAFPFASYTPTKCNLCFDKYFDTDTSEHAV
jgi:Fe-S-cluster-containing dehydrogenase component